MLHFGVQESDVGQAMFWHVNTLSVPNDSVFLPGCVFLLLSEKVLVCCQHNLHDEEVGAASLVCLSRFPSWEFLSPEFLLRVNSCIADPPSAALSLADFLSNCLSWTTGGSSIYLHHIVLELCIQHSIFSTKWTIYGLFLIYFVISISLDQNSQKMSTRQGLWGGGTHWDDEVLGTCQPPLLFISL